MPNNKIKITALLSIALLTSPGFAKNINDNLLSAPQPYVSDVGNVEISFQTINNYLPETIGGPAIYTGTATVSAAINNNSSNAVSVSCTGKIVPRICAGNSIKDCTWTDQSAISITSFSANSIPVGSNAVATFSSTSSSTVISGWGLEVYSRAGTENADMITCTITDDVTSAIATKIYFIPVA